MVLLFYGLSSNAQDLSKYEQRTFNKGKDTLVYRILYPENFNPKKQYPVVFFLHGAGERGNDNYRQLTHGAKLFLKEEIRKQFAAIVVFPQCPSDSYWANVEFTKDVSGNRIFNFQEGGKATKAMEALLGIIDHITEKPYADKKRVYAGGLSMGGMGTYELLRRRPKMFAAAFAICGGDNVANVQKYSHVPLWIFHGEQDNVVPVSLSTTISDQLKVLGHPAKLTLYPEANHNSWDSAFAEPDLLSWLFSNKKK